MGWEFLCSLDIPTYPNLVREFYENAEYGKGAIVSIVKGTPILVNIKILGNIMRVPIDGVDSDMLEDRKFGVQTILGRKDVNEVQDVFANQLPPEMRLLHHIINRILFPKIGQFDYVFEQDILVMYHISEVIPLNLSGLMIRYMDELGNRKRASLPYDMVLTLLFLEHGINLEGKTSKGLLHTDTYNDRSLHRMGFIKVEVNGYTKEKKGMKKTEKK